jgi:hypothetical protein
MPSEKTYPFKRKMWGQPLPPTYTNARAEFTIAPLL